ncbi:hypothetical protein [Bifidobacterium samirii]|uniref:Uncharacterized protein n=1 Tax=Bifidobacterium samirii TaxID=2306974 RepID=A0A430FH20_9BIFI|nr:hypothetical protein [Bifidobacterium samirii]RSX52091.1 hypothetical protein D2E24_1820 [Bifidobacterium samirii]
MESPMTVHAGLRDMDSATEPLMTMCTGFRGMQFVTEVRITVDAMMRH